VSKEKQYKETKKSDGVFKQSFLVKKFAKNPENQGCNYSALQQTVRRLHKAYTRVYKKTGKKPRIKTHFKTIEYSKYGDGWKIVRKGEETYLYVQNIGEIYLDERLQLPENPKRLTITNRHGKVTASIFSEENTGHTCKNLSGSIGLDFGIKTFITTSEGTKIESPQFLKRKQKQLRRIKRQIKRSTDGNVKNKKLKIRRKLYGKIANQRRDFAHKLSKWFVDNYGVIAIEDLKLDTWVVKRGFLKNASNSKLLDLGIGEFIKFLEYKAENAGISLRRVAPEYTTQTCCECKRRQVLTLTQRKYSCVCGNDINRDVNAAKNILNFALGL
jgi:putative transposase